MTGVRVAGRQQTVERARGRRPSWRNVLVTVAALLTLGAWAMASAPGSSPDDDFHLPSIWCAHGTDSDHCSVVPEHAESRLVPAEVAGAACFAFDNTKSAGCQDTFDGQTKPSVATTRGNWTHLYPPGFYEVMRFYVGDSVSTSVLAMRIVNGILTIGMLSALAILVPIRLRAVALVPLLVTSVPLGLSLFVSTNPSSWTILSAAVLWVSLYAAFEVRGRKHVLLQVYAVLAMLLGSSSRGDGCLFSLMAVALVIGLRFRELPTRRGMWITLSVCVVVPVLFLLGSHQVIGAVTSGLAPSAKPVSWFALAVSNFQSLPIVWFGSLGYGLMGGTGWLDTTSPPLVGFLTVFVWGGVVFSSCVGGSVRKALALVLLGSIMVAYPLYLLGQSNSVVGTNFQPRYLLPVLVVLTGVSMLESPLWRSRLSLTQCVLVVGALSLAQCIALYTQIRRYVTGFDVSGLNLDAGREWWWGGPISAVGVWLVGSLAFGVLCVALLSGFTAHGSSARRR